MFGDDNNDDRPVIRICCGPRCGAEVGHRGIYTAVAKFAEANAMGERPTLCQGFCGLGVTVVMPNGEIAKIRTASEVPEQMQAAMPNQTTIPCF